MNPLHNTTSHAEKRICTYQPKLSNETYTLHIFESHWAKKKKTCQVESLEVNLFNYLQISISRGRQENNFTIYINLIAKEHL